MQPTGRFYTFLGVAFLLYLAANQTQVNWLYVMAALLAGVVPVAWWHNRAGLRGLSLKRMLNDGSDYQVFYETDEITITLTVSASRRRLAQVSVIETCPIAAPSDQKLHLFVPVLPSSTPLMQAYTVTLDQRGVYTFPPLTATTRAPFGLFRREAAHLVETNVLIYPEVCQLDHLDLLDRQMAAQVIGQRVGYGSEVLGVRGYQPGDPQRYIHWRSVARTGQLVTKEFAEETQPGVSIVLDRCLLPGAHPKHNPFEWAIKAGVAVAHYAHQHDYPVHLHADPTDLPPPHGAISWDALLQYTARLHPQAHITLPELLAMGGFRQVLAVMVTQPVDDLLVPLVSLNQTGARLLVVLPNPATFPGGGVSAAPLADALSAEQIDTVTLTYGEDWAAQLAAHSRQFAGESG